MSYKTGRGNVTKKGLRFHAAVKMVFDYKLVTKYTVAASRRWVLIDASWLGFECAPARDFRSAWAGRRDSLWGNQNKSGLLPELLG